MHKIAFSGIPGSGKTSILAEVKKILSLKSRIEDAPDLRLSSRFDFDQKAGFISQFFFISNQINEENIRSLSQPDFLLCDCSILDHWVKWQKFLAEKKTSRQLEEKDKLLKSLYQFWIATYTVMFRIRVDKKELEKRLPKSSLRTPEIDHSQPLDHLYSQIILADHLVVVDIWNHKSIDESAQEVLKKIGELKLL
jgi:deoxyadenosine/deoxycytidine kinase